mgnify:CR=1 FL=1
MSITTNTPLLGLRYLKISVSLLQQQGGCNL